MPPNESLNVFIRFITERHRELITSLDQLTQALVGENSANKVKNAEVTLSKAQDLKSAMSQQDCPHWLPRLIQSLHLYTQNRTGQKGLLEYLFSNFNSIKQHKWDFDNSDQSAFDFDSIYEHYKSESRIPELFDEIIRILEEIQSSGEIDSISMNNALNKLLITLQSNKNSSYFSLNSAWQFLTTFMKNYMWTELAKLPGLGSAVEALEKTLNDTSKEMYKLHTSIERKMSETVENEIKAE